MGMVMHKVKILHIYQDKDSPNIQEVTLECDYATAYAFFKALIDSQNDFNVEIDKETKP